MSFGAFNFGSAPAGASSPSLFGASAPTFGASAPPLCFGAQSAAAPTFGAPAASSPAAGGFSFGSAPAAAGFGLGSAPASSAPGFAFGTPATGSAPTLSFGAPVPASSAAPAGISFGASAAATGAPATAAAAATATGFSFGGATTSTPAFSFGGTGTGAASAPAAPAPAFAFGGAPTTAAAPASTATPTVSFSMPASSAAAATPASTPTFAFPTAASAASTAVPAAASSAAAASTPAFSFSMLGSAPTAAATAAATAPASTPAFTLAASAPAATSAVGAAAPVVPVSELAAPSEIQGKPVDDIINEWTVELERRSRSFVKHAEALSEWDRAILSNRGTLLGLEEELRRAAGGQEALEKRLQMLEAHQKGIHEALTGMEGEAERLYREERALGDEEAVERDRLYESADRVSGALARLGDQLGEAIANVNEATAARLGDASTPLSKLVRILNNQLQALTQLEAQTDELSAKLVQVQAAAGNGRL